MTLKEWADKIAEEAGGSVVVLQSAGVEFEIAYHADMTLEGSEADLLYTAGNAFQDAAAVLEEGE